MRRCSKNLVIAVVAYFLFSTGMLAQNAALSVWQGVLRDAAGVPIHGAGVRLEERMEPSSDYGRAMEQFRIELIPAGQYQLSVDANHDKVQYATPINIAGNFSDSCHYAFGPEKSLCNFGVRSECSHWR